MLCGVATSLLAGIVSLYGLEKKVYGNEKKHTRRYKIFTKFHLSSD